jgi:hypothetical protein
MKIYNKFTEQQDNLICTFVKLYCFNVSYGLLRASQHLSLRYSTVSNRYYKKLRDTRQIFGYLFGDKVIWNTRSIAKNDLDKFKSYEGVINAELFEDLDNRKWWDDK